MKMPTVLIAHPYPIVVDALATLMAGAGFAVTRACDPAAAAAGLAESPDVAVIAAVFDGATVAGARNGRTLVLDGDADGAIALTASVERIAAAIAMLAGERLPRAGLSGLTRRECDVTRLVAAGQRNRGIATTLGISEGTVKMHLHNVYVKLGPRKPDAAGDVDRARPALG